MRRITLAAIVLVFVLVGAALYLLVIVRPRSQLESLERRVESLRGQVPTSWPIAAGRTPSIDRNILPDARTTERLVQQLGAGPILPLDGAPSDAMLAALASRAEPLAELHELTRGTYAAKSDADHVQMDDLRLWLVLRAYEPEGCIDALIAAARFGQALHVAFDRHPTSSESQVLQETERALAECAASIGAEPRREAAEVFERLANSRTPTYRVVEYPTVISLGLDMTAVHLRDSSLWGMSSNFRTALSELQTATDDWEALLTHRGPIGDLHPAVDVDEYREDQWSRLQLRLFAALLRSEGLDDEEARGAIEGLADPHDQRPLQLTNPAPSPSAFGPERLAPGRVGNSGVHSPTYTDDQYDGMIGRWDPPSLSEALSEGGVRGRILVPDSLFGPSLPRETIQAVVRGITPEVRNCYEQALNRRPDLEGRVLVRFQITALGSVESVSSSSTLGSARAEQCVMDRVRTLRFPAPAGGVPVTVSYPFVFTAN